MKSEQSGPTVYQLKITLDGITPPIWRRVHVTSDSSLGDLHDIIQAAMGWDNSHLHVFTIGKKTYGPSDDADDCEWMDELEFCLDDALPKGRNRAEYTYDFGDSWVHTVEVEKRLPIDEDKEYPLCIDGARACPPEDCGGIGGYARAVAAMSNPDSPEHSNLTEWLGDWDPEHFSIEEVNESLEGCLLPDFDEDGELDDSAAFTEETAFRLLYWIRDEAKGAFTGKKLESILEEVESMSLETLAPRAAEVMTRRPEELAQMLGTAAFASEDVEEAVQLANDSLQIDPQNSDAMLVLASLEESVKKRLPKLRKAFETAEKRLAKSPFATHKDDDLASVFVLPYLRAAIVYLTSLLEAGDKEGASQCIRRALENDPQDVQHTRAKILQSCLIAEELDLARMVLASYIPDDACEYDELLWGRILERYLAGDVGGACDTLKLARERNPFAEFYYTDADEDAELSPEEEDLDFEAERFFSSMGYAWEAHPLALAWLRAECART